MTPWWSYFIPIALGLSAISAVAAAPAPIVIPTPLLQPIATQPPQPSTLPPPALPPPLVPPPSVPPEPSPQLFRALIPNCNENGYQSLITELSAMLPGNTGRTIPSGTFDVVSAVNYCQVIACFLFIHLLTI